MLLVVLISVFGLSMGQLVTLPHGHDLRVLVEKAFGRLDHNPKDGIVEEAEWDVLIENEDLDNNTCVDLAEYTKARPQLPVEITTKIFHHFDQDSDNCLTLNDMQADYHVIDHNNDNTVSMHEWDQYFTHLVTQLFGHGAGHGHNG